MSDNLHERLVAEVERRFRVAVIAGNQATRTEWSVEPWTPPTPDALPASSWVVAGPDGEDGIAVVNGSYRADHIALHDPADAIRRYEADLRRLERHQPKPGDWSLVRGHESLVPRPDGSSVRVRWCNYCVRMISADRWAPEWRST